MCKPLSMLTVAWATPRRTDARCHSAWRQCAPRVECQLMSSLRAVFQFCLGARSATWLASSVCCVDNRKRLATPGTLHIDGPQLAVVITDIDRTDVFPMVEPLIVAWGGRLGGTGTERPVHSKRVSHGPNTTPPPSENHRLMVLCLGCLGLLIAACATTGCLGTVLAAALELR